jgi:hypothetical protein
MTEVDPTTGNGGQPGGDAGERPAWLPEKFKTPEDLAKSYTELEKKLGKPREEVSIERPAPTESVLEVDDALAAAGLTLEDIEEAVRKHGKPLEKHYAALAKVKMPRSAVDRMVRAEVILRDATTRSAIEAAGGEEQIHALREWAGSKESGITDAEIKAFNDAVGRAGSPEAAKAQVEYLMWKAEKSGVAITTKAPSLVSGSPATGAAGGFKSFSEYGAASMAMYEGRMTKEEFDRRDRATPASVKSQPGVRSR